MSPWYAYTIAPVSVYVNSKNDGRRVTISRGCIAKAMSVLANQTPQRIYGEIFDVNTDAGILGPIGANQNAHGKYYFAGTHFPDDLPLPSETLYGLRFTPDYPVKDDRDAEELPSREQIFGYIGSARDGRVKLGITTDLRATLKRHERDAMIKFAYHAVFIGDRAHVEEAERRAIDHYSHRALGERREWLSKATPLADVTTFFEEIICVKYTGRELEPDELNGKTTRGKR